jgi:RNA polymerase sigma-70 factor (ECF subfamily)
MDEKYPGEDNVKLLKKGDMLAFDAIYKAYCQRLYGFVLKFIKQKEDAQEIVQEVFLKIWESRAKIDVYASFEGYLFATAYNVTISLLRKRLNQDKYIAQLKGIQSINEAEQSIDEVEYNELAGKVQSLIGQLSPRQQEIFYLSREKGLTHEEIAERLNISVNTVKNHMVSSLKFLRSHLDHSLLIQLLFISLFF